MTKSDKIYDWLNNKIGLPTGFVILLVVILFAYKYNQRIELDRKQATTYGISLGVKKGSKGTLRLHYEFKVDKKFYYGFVPEGFCKGANQRFCDSGEVVYVKFQYDNPDNNTLIEKEP